MDFITRLVAMTCVVSIILSSAVIGPASFAFAANPATDDAASFCEVLPEFSTGVQGGVSSVAPGETITVQNRLVLGEGDIYQDIIVDPDGTTYYASWIQLAETASSVSYDDTLPALSYNGAPIAFSEGTTTVPGEYVFDSTLGRMYFPGDPTVIDNGVGEVSFAAAAGDELVLSRTGVVTNPQAGVVEQIGECAFSISSGDENRTEALEPVFIGVSGVEVVLTKSADPTVVVGGSTVTYSTANAATLSAPTSPTGTTTAKAALHPGSPI